MWQPVRKRLRRWPRDLNLAVMPSAAARSRRWMASKVLTEPSGWRSRARPGKSPKGASWAQPSGPRARSLVKETSSAESEELAKSAECGEFGEPSTSSVESLSRVVRSAEWKKNIEHSTFNIEGGSAEAGGRWKIFMC